MLRVSRASTGSGAPSPLLTIERVPPAECGLGPGGVDGRGDSGVRRLTLRSPTTLNSLTVASAEAFQEAMEQLQQDQGLRALVITGEGRAFSAGGDFEFIEDRIAGDVADNARVLGGFYPTFLALRRLPVPVIAAVNGPAVGGGAGLAMAADVRIASSAAKMSFNFVKLGLTPGMASTLVLPSATNHQVATRLLLTGDVIDAFEAKELGLMLQVTDPDRLLPTAQQLAGRMASASPSAAAETLRLLRGRLPWEALEAAALQEAKLQAVFFKQPDCREGVDSVRGKRPAQFGPRQRADTADADGA